MTPTNLAVLSDLHVGRASRARDLCPYSDTHGIDTDYRRRFLEFVRQASIQADVLVLPGDVSDRAQPLEVELASQFVREVSAALGVKEDRIIFVPGNHDVDWSMFDPLDTTGTKWNLRYSAVRNSTWIFGQVMQRARPYLLDEPPFCIWEQANVVAVGYDSSSKDGPDHAVHHGSAIDSDIDLLETHLSSIDLSPSRLRIFLVHHHPLLYSDPVPDAPEFSAITNGERLLSVLRRHHFDLLVHGHRHCPRFKTSIVNSSFPLAILCAGSFSATLDTRWIGTVSNQFHLLSIEGRDADSEHVYGVLKSWAYQYRNGWVRSSDADGIAHRQPFGTYVQQHVVRRDIEPILRTAFESHEYLRWSTLVSGLPHLQYLSFADAKEVLDTLATQLSFSVVDKDQELILLKEGGL